MRKKIYKQKKNETSDMVFDVTASDIPDDAFDDIVDDLPDDITTDP